MITELRNNLDVIVVVIVALGAYHFYKKVIKGDRRGISK